MSESERQTIYRHQTSRPKPLNEEGTWIAAERSGGKVTAWEWIQGGEPDGLFPEGVTVSAIDHDRGQLGRGSFAAHVAQAEEDRETSSS